MSDRLPSHKQPYLLRTSSDSQTHKKRRGGGGGCGKGSPVSSPQKETTELMISTSALEASGLGKNDIALLNFSDLVVECVLTQSHETVGVSLH